MRKINLFTTAALVSVVLMAGCTKEEITPVSSDFSARKSALVLTGSSVPLGTASTFAVLAGTTITSDGATYISGNIGVSPGTAITGFEQVPMNTIMGPGTVTPGLGIVEGIIYAGGPVAAQAHNDAVIAYNYLVSREADTVYSGVTQLDGLTFTPGVYNFAPSANLMVNGIVYLDFQGNSDAEFIFQMGTTLVTMAGSQVIALNSGNQTCTGSNVFWSVGSSATIDGSSFIGTVIANTTITMTDGANVAGRMLAIGGAVTMITDTISVCGASVTDPNPTEICRDFVTGGGWIYSNDAVINHKKDSNSKATFGVSGGIKNGNFWGQLSFNDHSKNGVQVKSTEVTSYQVIDAVTRKIEGIARLKNGTSVNYSVIVVDNGEPGRNDSFSLTLSNGYSISGLLKGGNMQLHMKCGEVTDHQDNGEKYDDDDEKEGNQNCENNDDDDNDNDDDNKSKNNHRR